MKWINENRTDKECLENVIKNINQNNTYKYEKNRKKDIKEIKNLSLKELRYIDNQLRIYIANQNWDKLSKSVGHNS
tara:strand:- start:810 stop:1037 length:228 start_codon:yes stop_codon:yes gene_type:complete